MSAWLSKCGKRRYPMAMAMLSQSGRRRALGPKRAAAQAGLAQPLAFQRLGGDLGFDLAGEPVRALQEGALLVERPRALIVSDLHLEKGSAYARTGQLLPPYDTRATLARLAAVQARVQAKTIISLGDSFHDLGAVQRMARDDLAALRALAAGCDWVWILGNHDPAPPADVPGQSAHEITLGGLMLRHEPAPGASPGEVAGHLHPCTRVHSAARAVRVRCFATDGARLVMPAFGAYTGGLALTDAAFAPLFPRGATALAIGRARVHAVAAQVGCGGV
jgi:uncharacterized protein